MQYIKIHSQDNVAVALTDIAAGSVVTIDNDSVTLGQDIVRGHKFALRAIAKGKTSLSTGCRLAMRWRISRRASMFMRTIRAPISATLTRIAINRTWLPNRHSLRIAKYRFIVAPTVTSACAMSCGSCRPSAASTRWPDKCRTVS